MPVEPQKNITASVDKKNLLFLLLAGFFLTNALLAEFIGVKIFSAEKTLGLPDAGFRILGYTLNFQLTAGVILWPVVFVITDIVNEYFGRKGVQRLTMMAIVLIIYAFLMVRLAIWLTPADWWVHWVSVLRSLNSGLAESDARVMAHAAFGLLNSTPHSTKTAEQEASREVLRAMTAAALRRGPG